MTIVEADVNTVIRRHTTYEIWSEHPCDLLDWIVVEEHPEMGDTPFALLDRDRHIISLHPTMADVLAAATCWLVGRRAELEAGLRR